MVTPEEYTSTAFGVMTAVQNGGLMLVNFFVNYLRGEYGDQSAMMFFVFMDGLGLLLALILYIVDRYRGGQLSMVKTNEPIVPTEDTVPDYATPFKNDKNVNKN